MSSRLNPYISFDGNARSAMEFYEHIFGGKLTLSLGVDVELLSDR